MGKEKKLTLSSSIAPTAQFSRRRTSSMLKRGKRKKKKRKIPERNPRPRRRAQLAPYFIHPTYRRGEKKKGRRKTNKQGGKGERGREERVRANSYPSQYLPFGRLIAWDQGKEEKHLGKRRGEGKKEGAFPSPTTQPPRNSL